MKSVAVILLSIFALLLATAILLGGLLSQPQTQSNFGELSDELRAEADQWKSDHLDQDDILFYTELPGPFGNSKFRVAIVQELRNATYGFVAIDENFHRLYLNYSNKFTIYDYQSGLAFVSIRERHAASFPQFEKP